MSTEENKALVRRAAAAFSAGDTASVDELYAADVVDHNAAPGTPPGREGLRLGIAQFHAAFPDLRFTIEDMLAEGDRVVTRGTLRGTHRGELFGIPPTGKSVAISGIDVWRVADGKLAEWWHQDDMLGLMQQLGVIPAPGQSAG